MLILTRKLGEMLRVGEDITVRVLEVRGSQVRLGIEAPSTVRIYREEIYRAIQHENGKAPETGAGAEECRPEETTPGWHEQQGKPRRRQGRDRQSHGLSSPFRPGRPCS